MVGQITYNKNGVSITRAYNQTVDVAGNTSVCSVIAVGTADETVILADVVPTGGIALFHNMDAAATIQIGDNATTYSLAVKPLEWGGPVRWNQPAIHVKASAGTPNLEIIAFPA
jgi:hypothetical protein